MDCKYVDIHIVDYMDGSLPDPEYQAVNKHRTACESCDRRLRQTAALTHQLGGMSFIPSPAYLENLVVSEVTRRYRRPLGQRLRTIYDDLMYPLRLIERRDIVIALISLPVALSFFLAIFFHIQFSIVNGEQIAFLTYTARPSSSGGSYSYTDAAPESEADSLMPVSMSSPSLVRFVESASETPTPEEYFLVMVHVNQEGMGSIEQVIEYPNDSTLLNKLNSLISSVKFRPARLRGKRVDSYFILAFNQVNVLG